MSSDTQRMIFGFCLLGLLAALAAAIALGKVEEKTSYGLMPLLTALATLAGGFANYAFSQPRKDDASPTQNTPDPPPLAVPAAPTKP